MEWTLWRGPFTDEDLRGAASRLRDGDDLIENLSLAFDPSERDSLDNFLRSDCYGARQGPALEFLDNWIIIPSTPYNKNYGTSRIRCASHRAPVSAAEIQTRRG